MILKISAFCLLDSSDQMATNLAIAPESASGLFENTVFSELFELASSPLGTTMPGHNGILDGKMCIYSQHRCHAHRHLECNMLETNRNLNLAFYEASDGPRIMLFGPLNGVFERLLELFEILSQGGGPFEFHHLPFIKVFGKVQLVASCTGSIFNQPKGKIQGLRRKLNSVGAEFEWQRTAEGWDYLAKLIANLVQIPASGHQYLSAYPKEDAILVVSKGEYGDEVIRQLESDSPGDPE